VRTSGLVWVDDVAMAGGRALVRAVPDDGRLRLELPIGRSGVDVSIQPGAVDHHVRDAARGADADPNRWAADVAAGLLTRAGRPPGADLVAAAGVVTHPLLAAAYATGMVPLREVPRWAVGLLRAPSLVEGVRGAFRSSSRELVRALAHRLGRIAEPWATLDLFPVATALALDGLLDADRLARLVRIEGPYVAPAGFPTVDELAAARRTAVHLGAARAGTIVAEALATTPWQLFPTFGRLAGLRHHLDATRPSRLAAVQALVAPATPEEVPVPVTPLRAPQGHQVATLPRPAALDGLDGLVVGDLRLRLPRRPDDLTSWGQLLHNCLADYTDAARAGRSWLVGIEHAHRLVGCVEIDPATRRLRQVVGDRNRPLPEWVTTPVVRALLQHHLIERP